MTSTVQFGFWDEIFVAAGEAMAWADDLSSLIVAGQGTFTCMPSVVAPDPYGHIF
eukprot:COSAG06_NODE_5472_length_3459_cov_200.129167_3_plen_55_part_00